MASSNVDEVAGLTRKPSSPADFASAMTSSRPYAVTIMIFGALTSCESFLILREASMPSIPGIFQSISTRSKRDYALDSER